MTVQQIMAGLQSQGNENIKKILLKHGESAILRLDELPKIN
ncbi:MAG: hypothetical protein JWP78_814 [Mucilaginibacter sp.]|nr:hypothetical protein [Mucilaginibacter sp.]